MADAPPISTQDRDYMVIEIRRRLEPFGIELNEINVNAADGWTEIRTVTSRANRLHVHESTSWHSGKYESLWAKEIGRAHLLGHYTRT